MDADALKRIEDRLDRIETLIMTMTPQQTKQVQAVIYETPMKDQKGWRRKRTDDPMWSPDEHAECAQVRKRIIFECKECQNFYEKTGHEIGACRHTGAKRAKKKNVKNETKNDRVFWELGFESESPVGQQKEKFQRTPPFSQESF